MNEMQRLIEAAKELNQHLWKLRDWSGGYVEKCLDDIDAAISDAERQEADDALPVDAKFLQELFPILESWCDNSILVGSGMLLVENAAESWSLWHEGEEIVEFMTRKKVRSLVELLKGTLTHEKQQTN